MSQINQYSVSEKLAILQDFEMGQTRRLDVAKKYDISIYSLVNLEMV